MAIKVTTLAQAKTESQKQWEDRANSWLALHDGKILQARVNMDEAGLSSLVALYEERDGIPGPAIRRPTPQDGKSSPEE